MNPLQIGAVVGLLVAAGVWCLVLSLRRAPRSLAAARHRMHGAGTFTGPGGKGAAGRVPAGGASPGQPPAGTLSGGALVAGLAAGAPGRWAGKRFGGGLAIIGMSPADVITRVLMAAGILLFAVLASLVALISLGFLSFSPLWLALAFGSAAMAAFMMIADVAGKIERRRKQLRQAANDFVQLVAVGLTTDQSVEEAIRFALSVGNSGAFDELRSELDTAPQRGLPVWEALEEFGRRVEVRELCEFAASIERQGMQGVSISETVASLAASMRAKALDQLEREADKANANLAGPTIGFVVTTIVFLAYPLMQRINEAFGG